MLLFFKMILTYYSLNAELYHNRHYTHILTLKILSIYIKKIKCKIQILFFLNLVLIKETFQAFIFPQKNYAYATKTLQH